MSEAQVWTVYLSGEIHTIGASELRLGLKPLVCQLNWSLRSPCTKILMIVAWLYSVPRATKSGMTVKVRN